VLLGIHRERLLDNALLVKSRPPLCNLLKKTNKNNKRIPRRRGRQHYEDEDEEALSVSLDIVSWPVSISRWKVFPGMCAIFFFFPLSSTHSKRERCLKTTTTCVFRPRCRNVRNVFLSLHACAKRLNSSLLSSSFKNKPAKLRTVTLLKQQRIWNIQNRRDLRFTEREKVAHHRTDYQVTLYSARVV